MAYAVTSSAGSGGAHDTVNDKPPGCTEVTTGDDGTTATARDTLAAETAAVVGDVFAARAAA